MTIRKRLRSLLWRVPIEQEVHDELAHHAELRTRELIDRGVDPGEAHRLARMRLENGRVEAELTRLGRQRNQSWARRDWLDELPQDLTFAMRQCRSRPGFTLAAVLTLGLGIGATTAIFSVVHAVVLKPYAYADPDRVLVTFSLWNGNRGSWSVGNFDYFRQRLTTVDEFAAGAGASFNLADDGEPERVFGRRVTANFFPLFGIPPAFGRTFTSDEDQPGRTTVVVLSDRVWRRRFNADPSIVGRKIRMNNEPYDVIGVMPPEFDQIGDPAQVWIPVGFTPAQLAMYDEFYLDAYARQKHSVTLPQVNDDFVRVGKMLATDHPEMNHNRSAGVDRLSTFLVGDYRLRLLDPARGGGSRAAHRLRQCRQPVAGQACGTIARDGHPRRDRRRPRTDRPPGADREPGAGSTRRRGRPCDRVVDAAGPDSPRARGRASSRYRYPERRSHRGRPVDGLRQRHVCRPAPRVAGDAPNDAHRRSR